MRSFFFFLFLLPFFSFAQTEPYESRVHEYIAKYKDIAIEEMQRAHIPASITLAQGILESDAGRSPLATEANNHFGVKCHENWTGDTYHYDDDEKNECFRKYESPQQSYKDHSDFLTSRDRYAALFTYKITDYKSWANGLKKAGYATNPHYASLLIKNIEKYELYQYDYSQDVYAVVQDSLKKNISPIVKTSPKPDVEDIGARVMYINNVRAVKMMEGETLTQLGKRFDIGLRRVLKYNDLLAEKKLPVGTIVYLQPKHRIGDSIFHYVKNNETMYEISQLHGIQLAALYMKNKMNAGAEPANGEVIYLKDVRATPVKLRDNNEMYKPSPTTIVSTDSTANMITVPDDYHYYTVKVGDTLYSIAKAYNIKVEKLKEINKLYSDIISVGMRLRIAD